MNLPLRVGIVGLSSERGWAAIAHVPALREVQGVELVGACASSPESSALAAKAHGLDRVYESPDALVASADVDLVVIAVKVSGHRPLVDAALDSGKAVMCEWPLGNGLHDAESMARRAAERGATTVVGLQVLSAPFLVHLGDLVASGAIGEVLSTTIVASGSAWGATFPRDQVYLLDPREGATMLTIPMGHTLAGVEAVLGRLTTVQSATAIRRPSGVELPSRRSHERRTPDQTVVVGTLESGAMAVFHYRGGMCRGTNFHWEINGTDGDIVVTGTNGHMQMGLVEVAIAGKQDKSPRPLPTPPEYERVLGIPISSPAYTVAHAYERMVHGVRTGTKTVPDFADAVRHHRLIAAIEKAASDGATVKVS